MKKILALVIVAFGIGQANANVPEPKSPIGMSLIKSGDICKLYYRGEETGNVEVTIYNEDGRVVFRDLIRKTDNFMRPYNFSALPEGNYTIELNDGERSRSEKVSHFHAVKNEIVANLVRVNKAENKYVLGVHKEGSDPLTVRVFDENHNLLFQKTDGRDGDFAKFFNLNDVKGRHFFEISDRHGAVIRLTRSSVLK